MCTSDYAAPIPDPNHFRVSNKLFLIWDIEQHKAADFLTNEDYCFNHVVGLPPKNGSQSANLYEPQPGDPDYPNEPVTS
jgi:hypothetical protein